MTHVQSSFCSDLSFVKLLPFATVAFPARGRWLLLIGLHARGTHMLSTSILQKQWLAQAGCGHCQEQIASTISWY
jgi:hypothetical protein